MLRTAAFALVVFATAAPAVAGHCYGTLFENGQPLAGAHLILTCGSEVVRADSAQDGGYRLFARTTGTCTLQVTTSAWSASTSLNSYDGPAANNFNVVGKGPVRQMTGM